MILTCVFTQVDTIYVSPWFTEVSFVRISNCKLKNVSLIELLCSLLDSAHLSKSALKNKKRAEKRTKARIEQIKENGGTLEAIEMKDPVAVLREQLQEAKDNKVHVASEWLKSNWKKW